MPRERLVSLRRLAPDAPPVRYLLYFTHCRSMHYGADFAHAIIAGICNFSSASHGGRRARQLFPIRMYA